MKRSLILALFSLILATACAPFPQNLMRDAQLAVSVSDVQKEPDRYRGEVVIWGGVVIDALNRRDETVLKVMQTDLDFQKRPTNTARSPGRFLVRCKGFLDPYIYSKGREITIAGVIIGKEEQNIGEILYAYPVLEAQEIRLWEERQDPQYWGPPYWWGYPYPWWPGYPYWW